MCNPWWIWVGTGSLFWIKPDDASVEKSRNILYYDSFNAFRSV
jgi:hypothetical protein